MADELAIKVKIPEGAVEVLIRVPYVPILAQGEPGLPKGGAVVEFFYPKDVSVDFREIGGVWTPAELTGPDAIHRVLQ